MVSVARTREKASQEIRGFTKISGKLLASLLPERGVRSDAVWTAGLDPGRQFIRAPEDLQTDAHRLGDLASPVSPAQWQAVLSKQQGHEHIFQSPEDAEAHLRPEHGLSLRALDCRNEVGEILGRVFRWWHPLGDTVRLAVRHGDRWAVYDGVVGITVTQSTQASTRRLVTVQREQLEWMWPGRIPLGHLDRLQRRPARNPHGPRL